MTGLTLKIVLRFLGVTLALAGAAAFVTGRAIAHGWRPPVQIVGATFGLALAARFIDYALFGQSLTWGRLGLDYALLLALGFLGHRLTRARQMREQYPWLAASTDRAP